MRYYDLRRHWNRGIAPHSGDSKLNDILIRDFNKFTYGCWRQRFTDGQFPCEFESCDWSHGHRGPELHFWWCARHFASRWLVNFNLRL